MSADKSEKSDQVKITDNETRYAFSGPAFYSNRIFSNNFALGMRLSFMEQLGDVVVPQFRTAVILSYPDAMALRDLLSRQLEKIKIEVVELKEGDDKQNG